MIIYVFIAFNSLCSWKSPQQASSAMNGTVATQESLWLNFDIFLTIF